MSRAKRASKDYISRTHGYGHFEGFQPQRSDVLISNTRYMDASRASNISSDKGRTRIRETEYKRCKEVRLMEHEI